MARNPFVTVPGGPEWAQRAWVQAYLRNQALEYNRVDPRTAMAVGAVRGLDEGIEGFFAGRREGRATDNRFLLEMMQESARQREIDALTERQQQAARAAQEAALLKQTHEGLAYQELARLMTPTEIPGTGNPFAQQPIPFSPDREERGQGPFMGGWPQAYPEDPSGEIAATVDIPATPPTMRPGLSSLEALGGMNPYLAGLLDPATRTSLLKGEKDPQLTQESLNVINQLSMQDPAAATRLKAKYGLSPTMGPKPKTAKEEAEELKAGLEARAYRGEATYSGAPVDPLIAAGLVKPEPQRPGLLEGWATRDQHTRVAGAKPGDPLLDDPAIRKAYGENPAAEAERIRQKNLEYDTAVRAAETRAAAEIQDQKDRAKARDEAKRDFAVLTDIVPRLTEATGRLLQPGVAGKVTGLAREKINAWTGAYPELNELIAFGTAIQGAVTRRVLLESGAMTAFDVGRALALIPQASDNLEVGMAKLRVMSVFLEASAKAWDEYERSGLAARGVRMEKPINDFLPQNFWSQAMRTSPEPPPGFRPVKP